MSRAWVTTSRPTDSGSISSSETPPTTRAQSPIQNRCRSSSSTSNPLPGIGVDMIVQSNPLSLSTTNTFLSGSLLRQWAGSRS